jgi:hypothetical protein
MAQHEPPLGFTRDTFGNLWPERFIFCPTCGLPDNCGDCDHTPWTWEQVVHQGGTPTEMLPVIPVDLLVKAARLAMIAEYQAQGYESSAKIIRLHTDHNKTPGEIADYLDRIAAEKREYTQRVRKDPAVAVLPDY